MPESIEQIIKKIPIAIENLKATPKKELNNYIHNIILSCLKDKETLKKILEDNGELERLARL